MKKLVIRNLKDYFKLEFDKQFQILGELEKQIQQSESIENTILIPYKDEGDVIFDLVKIDYLKSITVFTYQYSTTIS